MSVSAVGSAPVAVSSPQPAPQVDLPNDGDSDDVHAAPVQAAPVPGTGTKVDKTA